MGELNTQPIMKFIDNSKVTWKKHFFSNARLTKFIAESCGQVVNSSASYSGGLGVQISAPATGYPE